MFGWFGCSHNKTSLPVTRRLKAKESDRAANVYVLCLKCGQQFPYSFKEMKTIAERRTAAARAESDRPGTVAVEAANPCPQLILLKMKEARCLRPTPPPVLVLA